MKIKILCINGSPRPVSSSAIMLEHAVKGLSQVKDVETDFFSFAGKNISGCRASCSKYCMANGKCSIDDDVNTLLEKFMAADGVIWSVPAYHVGPPAQVKAALDRMGNVLFSYLKGEYPRFSKPCLALVQGSSRWGGQELVEQFFLESFALLGCIAVTGDMPQSYFGVAGYAPTWEPGCIKEDAKALATAENAGLRLAEMTKIVKAGIESCKNELPDIYFPNRIIEKRKNTAADISLNWQKQK